MRFKMTTVATVAALAVAATALPKKDWKDQTWKEKFPWYDTCNGTDAKTQESWKKYDVGEWFRTRANAEDKYTQDIQKTIQSWGTKSSALYEFYCSPLSDCDANFDRDQCLSHDDTNRPRLYFIMTAIKNFNNWMLSVWRAVEGTSSLATTLSSDMVDTFAENIEKVPISTAGPVLAAGALGAIGAIIPATGPAAGLGGALATIATGIITTVNDAQDIELEPKFNDFKDITKWIGQTSEKLQTGIEKYTQWVLTTIPKNDRDNGIRYIDDPKSLPNVLLDGEFAEPKTLDVLDDSLYVPIFSSAISILWKEQLTFVVKVPVDDTALGGEKPCDLDEFFNYNKYCDDDGNAYLLLKWLENPYNSAPWHDGLVNKLKDVKGVRELERFHMGVETVVKASAHAWELNGKKPYYEWTTDKVVDHFAESERNLAGFAAFNFPYCDLSKGGYHIDKDKCSAECQIIYQMSNCFPTLDMRDRGFTQFSWSKEKDFNPDKKQPCLDGTIISCD